MALQENMNTLMQGLKSRVGSGMFFGNRIQYNASTTLTVADHKALAPTGFELWGWKVICIGGGGGGSYQAGGLGGFRREQIVSLLEAGSPATIAIAVGAGGTGSNDSGQWGGASKFGSFVIGYGGESGDGYVPRAEDVLFPFTVTGGTYPTVGLYTEGTMNGACTPSGRRGAAGGSAVAGERFNGGAAYPHPNSFYTSNSGQFFGRNSFNQAASNYTSIMSSCALMGAGVSTGSWATAGHAGIGDWCGGGGSALGVGGFPGGGGGSSNQSGLIGGKGGDGTVIVYPIFRKKL